ncbi:cytosolic carboxypeptidase 3 isoform X1 [Rana temporaria]|uniref:cytosolic carboxypeptidase 3 isoform X1 n=1 Tax=Rana temporaria TaxID=8407 RepID=UPI001AAD31C4|nr:cytosolic carboxypeptidase 3 isoform X1 [Rana temporaria]
MCDEAEIQDVLSEHSSSSQSESEEDPYESEDVQPYEFYSAGSFFHPCPPRTTQVVFDYHSGKRVARLKSPRDLYGVSLASFYQLPRWPYECQVLKEKIEHIEWEPLVPEPIYRLTGLEEEPACTDPLESKVVYQVSEGWKELCFMCSRVGGNRSPLKPVSSCGCDDSELVFESRFESGNLLKAVQVGKHEYELTLRTDLYTNRHTQWYYFRVTNMRAGILYRFTIINFMKPTSLYNHGMRPLMYSEKEATTRQIGWKRIGDEIKYYKNNLGQDGQSYYSLSWTFRFPHSRDVCYFAHCYPYTYSNLQDYLAGIASDPERSKFCKMRVLCHSLAGNIVYVLTITSPSPAAKESKKKKAVILTARVHPGETNSSWVMKGFLDYILSSQIDAQLLRDTFVFKVVPMLNPDGVIVGNYRCSLTGRDLNRNYKSRLKDSFPSIWFTRNMIKRVMEEREILLYCDLHGHSKKQNVFMYGCKGRGVQNGGRRLSERLFPFILSKNSPDKFCFSGCKFKVQRNKEGTGRVVMWKMGIQNSYTLEATFCGSTLGNRRGTHFSTKDLESLGQHFCDALLDYCDPDRAKYIMCLKELEDEVKQNVNHQLSLDSEAFLNILSDLDSSTGGSDSSDSNDPPAHLMELACKGRPRKKLLKSKRERNSQRKQPKLNPFQEQQDNNESTKDKERTDVEDQPAHGTTVKQSSLETPKKTQKGSKQNKATWSKKQSEPLLQDLNAKKVSVIYLVFDSNGEVISTKSHSYASDQNAIKLTSRLKGFHWNRPLPLFKSLLPQRFPLNCAPEPSCYYIIPQDVSDTHVSNISLHGSGDGVHKSVKGPFAALYSDGKLSSSGSLWAGDSPLERDTASSVLAGEVVRNDLSPLSVGISGSASPLAPNDMEVLSNLYGSVTAQGNDVRWRQKNTSSAPLDREDCAGSRRDKDGTASMKGEISLPAVTNSSVAKAIVTDEEMFLHPTTGTRIWHVRNTLPKMVTRSQKSKSFSSTSVTPPRKGNGQSANGLLQKKKLGRPICPFSREDQADRQYPMLPMSTWKDVMIGLQQSEGGAPLGGTPLQFKSQLVATAPKEDISKHRTYNSGNTSKKPGQRVSLAPLPKQISPDSKLCLNYS